MATKISGSTAFREQLNNMITHNHTDEQNNLTFSTVLLQCLHHMSISNTQPV